MNVAARLAAAGFVAADDEAGRLVDRAAGDAALLEALVTRRLTGEPLAWIVGRADFCGAPVRVDAGVYVPRWQSEVLCRRAVERLPADGVAVDVCTGSGAIAAALARAHPGARVVGCDVDERAVACAVANGVEVYAGDLYAAVPTELWGVVDVVVGVVPYVPTAALPLLQRDTLTFESPRSYDGGDDGADLLRRAVAGAPALLRRGGALLLELGGDHPGLLAGELARTGFVDVQVLVDDEGDVRGIEALLGGRQT